MNNQIKELGKMSADERRDFLDAHSVKASTQSYLKPMSDAELRQAQEDFAQMAIEKAKIDDDFSQIKEEFKLRLKPLTSQIGQKLQHIKIKALEMNGPVYKVPDYDNFFMHSVAEDGTYISGRMMFPEERQLTINPTLKANNE